MRDNAADKRKINKPCECLLNIDNTNAQLHWEDFKDGMSQSSLENSEAQQVFKGEDVLGVRIWNSLYLTLKREETNLNNPQTVQIILFPSLNVHLHLFI